jgi:hypothetical protein
MPETSQPPGSSASPSRNTSPPDTPPPNTPLSNTPPSHTPHASVPPGGTTLAAIDLGSNSFHMVLGRFVEGHPMVLDGMKEMVQLGAGLDRARLLSEASQERALECLARFGERVRDGGCLRLRR